MKQKNSNFFKKLKNAVFNFDEYKSFAEEKTSKPIVYLLLLMLMFSLIVTVCITIKVVETINLAKETIKEECPEFGFEDNNLVINEENKQFIINDEQTSFGFIIDSEKENLEEIEQANDYGSLIAILKNKIVIKNANGTQRIVTYKTLSEKFELNEFNKQALLDFLSSKTMIIGYIVFVLIAIISLYIAFIFQIGIDILLLSVVAFLLSRIIGIKLKYKSIFNISVYGITLSVILYLIYMVVNLFTGFNIVYFDIAYKAISYIYIVTALLIIKSDLIKQNMELTKIAQVQKQVREEKQEEEDKERKKEEEKKEQKKKEKQEKKKEQNEEGQAPEGTGA